MYKHKFAEVVKDINLKTFVVYVVLLKAVRIYFFRAKLVLLEET